MEFSSGFFGSLITGSGRWKIRLTPSELFYYRDGKLTLNFSYLDIVGISLNDGHIWADITIQHHETKLTLDGIDKKKGRQFYQQLNESVANTLIKLVEPHQQYIDSVLSASQKLLSLPRYLSHHDIISFVHQRETQLNHNERLVLAALANPLFPTARIPNNSRNKIESLIGILQGKSNVVYHRNEHFISNELLTYKDFFDKVEKSPLTDEQRRAAIVMEDRNLLIAAAGSGKTSTVVAKVGYCLIRGYVNPDQILVLAFNDKAKQELANRLNERLHKLLNGKTIKSKTFHSLGMEAIAEVENVKPSIADFSVGANGANKFFHELIHELTDTDLSFRADFVNFISFYLKPHRDPADFRSIDEWNQYVKETGEYEKGTGNGYKTFNGELVKSHGELAIANWLFANGVAYEYEKSYQYQTAEKLYRQYRPDFYFPQIDCYLEHYALNKNGNPPPAFGQKYLDSMEWKRSLHISKGTACFETYFHEFVDGSLFPKLESELTNRGIHIKPRKQQDILDIINRNQSLQTNELYALIQSFIKHVKANQLSVDELLSNAKNHTSSARAMLFLRLIDKILGAYSNKLRATNQIDYEDMIVKAADYASSKQYRHPFKLILVDEFQDISRDRAKMLSSLLRHDPSIKLFSVGDDWQSIYRFAGSDISLFTQFPELFGVTSTNYLTNTFRSNQGIADISSAFVQKNPAQVKKTVVAHDNTAKDSISVIKFRDKNEVNGCIDQCLNDISSMQMRADKPHHVMLLGRYNHLAPDTLSKLQTAYRCNLQIEFSTIHSAKGREADYVILLGLQAGRLGFPSLMADDPLLSLVMPVPETFSHAEERRLFYVALTRARHGVYLLASKFSESVFTKEIEGMGRSTNSIRFLETERERKTVVGADICPKCQRGRLLRRNGKYGEFWGCNQYPSCNYTNNTGGNSLYTAHSRKRR